jgi:hypothetical protein
LGVKQNFLRSLPRDFNLSQFYHKGYVKKVTFRVKSRGVYGIKQKLTLSLRLI